jgi:hypothetical protein
VVDAGHALSIEAELAGHGRVPHDLRSVGSTVEIVQQEGRPFAFVVTRAKSNALLTVQAMAALSAHGRVAPTVMHDRVDLLWLARYSGYDASDKPARLTHLDYRDERAILIKGRMASSQVVWLGQGTLRRLLPSDDGALREVVAAA